MHVIRHTHAIISWRTLPGVSGSLLHLLSYVAQSYAEFNRLSILLAILVAVVMLYPTELMVPDDASAWIESSPADGPSSRKGDALRVGTALLLASTSLELTAHAIAHVLLQVQWAAAPCPGREPTSLRCSRVPSAP